MKGTLNKIGMFCSSNYVVIESAIISAYLIVAIKPLGLGTIIGITLINLFYSIISAMFTKDEKKKIVYNFYRISLITLAYSLIGLVVNFITVKITHKPAYPVMLILGISATLSLGILLFKDKEKQDEIITKMLKNPNVQGESKEQELPVQLCIEKETKVPAYIEFADRFLHMLIIGPTGSGKTSQILLPLLKQDILNDLIGIGVIEPKGDLAEYVYSMSKFYGKECMYFNPVLMDCPYFNPLYGKEDAVIENMTTTFKMLTPDSKTYFQDMADNLIRKSLMVLKRMERAYLDRNTGISSKPATLIRFNTLIHNTNNEGARMIQNFIKLKATPLERKQNEDTAAWFLDEYFVAKSKIYENTSGIRTQVSKLISNVHLRRVLNPENGKSDINFEKALANGDRIAISTAQGDLGDLGSYLGYFLILSLQSAVFKRPGTEKTRKAFMLYIDEFQKYSNPSFSDMLQQGRSYRVGCHLATQARSQMAMGGGHDGKLFVDVVSANARNVVVLPGVTMDDATYYSKEFGQSWEEQIRTGETKQKFDIAYGLKDMNYPSESIQKSEVLQDNYTSTDVKYKEFGEITYQIIRKGSIQPAKDGLVEWIDRKTDDKIKDMVEEYRAEQQTKREEYERKMEEEYYAETSNSSASKDDEEDEDDL